MRAEVLKAAFQLALKSHQSQKRDYTNEPYIVHPVFVAMLCDIQGERDEVVAAALLHDVLEDTSTTRDEVWRTCGQEVLDLVIGVTSTHHFQDRAKRLNAECERLSKVSADAQTIKVADIIDNCRNIRHFDPDFAKVYIPEKAKQLEVLTKANPFLRSMARNVIDGRLLSVGSI